jgi:hypothetical protein
MPYATHQQLFGDARMAFTSWSARQILIGSVVMIRVRTNLAPGNSQSLMPHKQDTAIESVLSLLIRHNFYYLDRTASADQH